MIRLGNCLGIIVGQGNPVPTNVFGYIGGRGNPVPTSVFVYNRRTGKPSPYKRFWVIELTNSDKKNNAAKHPYIPIQI